MSVSPPRIWLNIELAHPSTDGGHERFLTKQYDPFAESPEAWSYSLMISQEDDWDAYVALLLGVIHTMRSRRRYRFRFLLPERLDVFRYNIAAERIVIEDLATEALFRVKRPKLQGTVSPAGDQLVRLVADWIVSSLHNGRDRDIRLLDAVARQCVRLDPDEPNHLYRLAAITCLQDDEAETIRILREGMRHDTKTGEKNSIGLLASAEVFLDSIYDVDVAAAKAAVYGVRALAQDQGSARAPLQKMLERSQYGAIMEQGISMPVGIQVLQRFLSEPNLLEGVPMYGRSAPVR